MIFFYPNDQQDEQTYGLLGQYTRTISTNTSKALWMKLRGKQN